MEKSTEELVHSLKKSKNIDEYLTNQKSELLNLSLADYLNKLLKEKSLKKSDVIRASGLEKTYVYDLFTGVRKNPTRDKLLALAFGLTLTLDETQTMLKYTGNAQLYARNQRDSILIFCLNNRSDLLICNELLYGKGEKILSE